jgi:DNA repair exonuclease SbcCD nuclease subunit
MKILHSADWHINLHKKKVPIDWSLNRFRLLFDKIHSLEKSHDVHILSGDVFDRKPEPDEICLFLRFVNSVTIPTYIIPGNHEATEKGETFLEHFNERFAITNPNVFIITKNERQDILEQGFCFFPYGEMQTDNLPPYVENDILVTHIRGEVPPHITAEYDFEKLRPWKLVLLGDIHFAHKYMDYPVFYCGSPVNVNFDRDDRKKYGLNSVSFNSVENYKVDFISLELPKLIRKTIAVGEKMPADKINHVIYELTGSIDELAGVKNSKLLDKKIAMKPTENSKLDLKNLDIYEELKTYLTYIKISNVDDIMKEFNNVYQEE